MKMVEFTYNKNRILIDADDVKKVVAAKPQEFDHTGMSRREYWETRLDRVAHKATQIIFKKAAEPRYQYVDQSFDEVSEILAKASGPTIHPR